MKIVVDFDTIENVPFLYENVEYIACETMERSRAETAIKEKTLSLSVTFLDDDAMREINRAYRGKDVLTDVISMGMYSDERDITQEEGADLFVGEIYLSWSYLQESAVLHDVSTQYECAYILSHGILHLLGYEHSSEMFSIQEMIASEYARKLKEK